MWFWWLLLVLHSRYYEVGCEQRETPIRPLTNAGRRTSDNSLLDYNHVKVNGRGTGLGGLGLGDEGDPWRDNERPKLYVDYLKGPLKGKTDHYYYLLLFILFQWRLVSIQGVVKRAHPLPIFLHNEKKRVFNKP